MADQLDSALDRAIADIPSIIDKQMKVSQRKQVQGVIVNFLENVEAGLSLEQMLKVVQIESVLCDSYLTN